jgi:hypothetical protein
VRPLRKALVCVDNADVAQLVEHNLAKVGVAGSNPVVRSQEIAGQAPFSKGASSRQDPSEKWTEDECDRLATEVVAELARYGALRREEMLEVRGRQLTVVASIGAQPDRAGDLFLRFGESTTGVRLAEQVAQPATAAELLPLLATSRRLVVEGPDGRRRTARGCRNGPSTRLRVGALRTGWKAVSEGR